MLEVGREMSRMARIPFDYVQKDFDGQSGIKADSVRTSEF